MFRDFKDKLSSEYEKAKTKIQTQAQNLVNNGALVPGDKLSSPATNTIKRSDSITSNDSRTVTETSQTSDTSKYSEAGFSLVDLDDEQSNQPISTVTTPVVNQSSTSKRGSDADSFFKTKFISNIVSSFVPQSDIESEYESESSSNKNLDNISKEQLLQLCQRLKVRSTKYREKWGEVVKVYRDTMTERDKLKNVLTETQDKAIRRINELKEQCNLEQEAKRHLEENLQMTIEEKEEQIKALQTKLDVINTGNLINLASDKKSEYTERITSLESQLAKANESLESSTGKINDLTKENEELIRYKETAEKLEKEIENVRKLKDSASTSFSEAKQKLHDELESRNIIIKELKDQFEKSKMEIKKKTNELKNRSEIIKNLNEKMTAMESTNETEKANLMEEFSRGKTAAINLIKEEYEKKLESVNEEMKAQIEKLTEENISLKEQENNDKVALLEEQKKQVEEAHQQNETLRKEIEVCNQQLAQSMEELDRAKVEREEAQQSLRQVLNQQEDKAKQFQVEIEQLNGRIGELNQLKEEFESTQKLLEEAKLKTFEASKELESVRKQLDETETNVQHLKEEKETFEMALKKEIEKHQTQSINQSETNESENLIRSLTEDIKEKSNKIEQLEKIVVLKDNEIIELRKVKSDLDEEIDSLKAKMHNFDADIDERLKIANEDHEKNLKMLADSKAVIVTLREDCQRLQNEIKTIQGNNQELSEKRTQLENELLTLNYDLTTFKNRLIQIFYSSYADSEIDNISSLDYAEFLTNIETAYRKTCDDNSNLINQIETLKIELNKLTSDTEQSMAKERSQHEFNLKSARELNNNLVKEIKTLRTTVAQQRDLEAMLEEKNVEIDTYREKNESLLEELEAVRYDLNLIRTEVKTKLHEIQMKDDQIYKLTNHIELKEKEIERMKKTLKETDNVSGKQAELIEELNRVRQTCDQHKEQSNVATMKCEELNHKIAVLSKQNATYLEEITKIKSNAKGILESKQKLQDKLKSSELLFSGLKQEYQNLLDQKKQQETEKMDLEKENKNYVIKEANLLAEVNELESRLAENDSKGEQIKKMTTELENYHKICSELEEKLKMKDNIEQDFKTEIIALEEKLKHSQHNDRDMQEEMKTSEKANKVLKEQIHKYLIEINELKNEIAEIKVKHEETVDKLYKQLEVRESQLDESLLNANSQYHSTTQELVKSRTEIIKLNAKLEELTLLNRDLELRLSTQSQENGENYRQIIEKYEYQIETLQTQLEEQKQEITLKMDQFDDQENRLISEHKTKIGQLENEVAEKNVALEEVHEYYQQRLKSKDNELKHLHEQLTSTDKNNYQINALQNSILQYHEENARLKELLNIRKERSNNETSGNNNNTTATTDMENCAILGVHLPQPTEYEYLRNILLEFMMGREPVTLAKVIAAVMRFNNEETEQIIKKQETLHSQHLNPAKRKA